MNLLRLAAQASDLKDLVSANTFGGLVVQKGSSDGVWTKDATTNVVSVDGVAVNGDPYLLDCFNQVVVTADTGTGAGTTTQTGSMLDSICGHLEFYIRLQSAQAGVSNSIIMCEGFNYRPNNAANIDVIDWAIERADDHEHYANVYSGVTL